MWRIVDIAENDRSLSLSHGNLVVSHEGNPLGRVPLADVHSVLVHGYGTALSANLLNGLADHGIPLFLCGPNHLPKACCLPVVGHFEQAERMAAQTEASLPTRKRIWKTLVSAKILAQAAALERVGGDSVARLRALARTVRAGDPNNTEAQAARIYWPAMMGSGFRRDPEGGALNRPLNYGYAVLRGAAARAVVAAGLNPSLGVFHAGKRDPFQLADDLMEPFRPLVDEVVRRHREDWADGSLDAGAKATLVEIANAGMATDQGTLSVTRVMIVMAQGLVEVFQGTRRHPWLPDAWETVTQGSLDLD